MVAAGLALSIAVISISSAQQTTPPATGGTLQQIENGAAQAGAKLEEGFASVRDRVHTMGVETRVYSRLHWDKDLADATLNVAVEHDGVVTLSGKVKDALAKTRAVTLTDNTVGVTRVVDQLTVATTPAP
jgi:osmotically-inducible protein OsmY